MTTRPPGSRWAVTLDVQIGSDGYGIALLNYPFCFFPAVLDSLPADRIVPLPDPEPEWQPGDVRLAADGHSWQSIKGSGTWFRVASPDGSFMRWSNRAEMEGAPRPMTPVIRKGRKWEES